MSYTPFMMHIGAGTIAITCRVLYQRMLPVKRVWTRDALGAPTLGLRVQLATFSVRRIPLGLRHKVRHLKISGERDVPTTPTVFGSV